MSNNFEVPFEDIVKYRRHIHENPEVSFEEFETADYIYNTLKQFPNITVEKPTKNSVLAILKGKKGKGKTIALRADIDALAVEELADVEFKSKKKGVMHACGHDIHAAMLMGAVKVLSEKADEISGVVKFIFQHAEEVPPGGAVELVKLGIMEGVDYVFGMHIYPTIPTGAIGMVVGPLTAATDIFEIKITGKGSHGSTPELSIDPITVGAELVSNLNNIVSRNVSALQNAVLSFGQFSSGDNYNVIPQTAVIKGTIRTTEQSVRDFMKKRLFEVTDAITKAYDAESNIHFINGYSAVNNDNDAVELGRATAIKVVGEQMVFKAPRMMGGEDFSAYTDATKGAFFGLGGGLASDGYGYMNHHPMFKVDENAMKIGAQFEVQLVLDILK